MSSRHMCRNGRNCQFFLKDECHFNHSKEDIKWLLYFLKATKHHQFSTEDGKKYADMLEEGFPEEEALRRLRPPHHSASGGGGSVVGRSTDAVLQMIGTGVPLRDVPGLCHGAKVARRKEAERICAMMDFFRAVMIPFCDGKTPSEISQEFSREFAAVARHVLTESGAGDF